MASVSPRHQENTNANPSSPFVTSPPVAGNGVQPHQVAPPKPITRSESAAPYPTTFVQANTSSFKQVVQMLTGSSDTVKHASASKPASDSKTHIPPIKSIPKKQQQQQQSGLELYKRRKSLKNLNISPLIPSFGSGFSPRKPDILSPSILDFPSLVLSPVTPLLPDPFDRSAPGTGSPGLDREAEERAIKEKGFFLHPSPGTTPRDAEPRLLSLFPTTSPRASVSRQLSIGSN
ncbi:VQ motif-containing protein 4-like isoform X1 [Prosopis cineraria]|uniref:VQ motif-containing protein 4-like isoform X2 n=1 Tax=Prosopis cineraria TaxID=364024 RepID=UPI00241050B5|nr:VQ motif-containing protein 4-like isoform X2 [Prosopis cineraria]XP_054792463.1 VQ motif-containing protein 4-like isoform X2 [Prosopis cineraria]XP_054802547.1 VQ motif-containing protein 4-like isoform X1 [Prosopis cineraria]XP_054802548.1 VQ motif-containing protein 4-like isoform X1 [Prosopis cineraria]